jgi:hypothetical protein
MLPILGILHSGVNWARASEAQFIGGEAENPCQMRGKTPLRKVKFTERYLFYKQQS